MPEPAPACAAWREPLSGWLVAQVGPEDEVALADHLADCERCSAEAHSLLTVTAVSLGADPGGERWRLTSDDPPPAELADRIVACVATERRTSRLRLAGVGLVVVAAATVLLVVLSRDDASRPDGEPVSLARLAPGVDAAATVAPEDGGSLIALTATGLDPAVTYALWLTPPGGGYPERVAAGTFRPDDDGTVDVTLRSALPVDEAGRVWATAPDGQVVLDSERSVSAPVGTPRGRAYAGMRSGTMPAIRATAR